MMRNAKTTMASMANSDVDDAAADNDVVVDADDVVDDESRIVECVLLCVILDPNNSTGN